MTESSNDTSAALTRRELLETAATIGAGAALATSLGGDAAMAEETPSPRPPAYRGEHAIQPLPFDPAKLKGLSERLLSSHHQNNYGGAVKRLNLIQKQLGSLPADAAPHQMGSLKREELIASNSMILHELYFDGLGGGGEAEPALRDALTRDFGSIERWRAEFVAIGKAMGGGSGWVLLTYSHRDGKLLNQWAADHTHSVAGATPVLVLDMYEHSYHNGLRRSRRYSKYVDAFMENIHWDHVSRLHQQHAR